MLGGQRQRFVHAVGVQRLRAAQHGGQRLEGHAHDVVLRLLGGERDAGRLGVEAHQPGARVLAPKVSRISRAQMRRAARYLAISSKKSLWALKKNDKARREVIDIHAARDTPSAHIPARRPG